MFFFRNKFIFKDLALIKKSNNVVSIFFTLIIRFYFLISHSILQRKNVVHFVLIK